MLLDTHTFLWFTDGDPRVSTQIREIITHPDAELFLSIASAWEIAIKVGLGKLPLHVPFTTLIPGLLERNGISLLNINIEHTARVVTLPLHHRDPFDRLLVAQALVEQLPIISRDAVFDAYNVTRIWE